MDLLFAAIHIEIMQLTHQGGITDWHISEAQKRLRSIRESNVGESILYASPDTARSFRIYAECIAVLAFMPGGITFAGNHFEVPQALWHAEACEEVA